MSETPKRAGARDISELKARLGLKKGGTKKGGGAGGVAPPPGLSRGGGVIPAPPGAQPNIPDASQDPFGAMQAMANHASASQTAQDFVIVNDGKPVESVEQKNKLVGTGKLVAMLVIPLVVGAVVGKISSGAHAYNAVIDDAAVIRDDIKSVSKQLINLQQILQVAKERGPGGNAFLLADKDLTTELEALPPIEAKEQLVYESSLYNLKAEVVAEVLGFYTDVAKLNAMVKAHVAKAKAEGKILQKGVENAKEYLEGAPYGALITIPTGEQAALGPAIKLVQLGLPVCAGDTKPNPAGPAACGAGIKGWQYRLDAQSESWGTKNVAAASEAGVSGDAIARIEGTKIYQQLQGGGKASVAETDYTLRIAELDALVTQLVETRKMLVEGMNKKAGESKKFTFFM